MTVVDIQNLTTLPIDEDFVRRAVIETLRYSKIKGTISVEVAFVGRAAARKLNKEYNNKNKAADILSFRSERKFITPKITGKYLGEIVVCPALLAGRAEFAHVIIHGVLHLIGYEHEKSKKDARMMHAKEEDIMDIVL